MFPPRAALMDNEITIRRAESMADYRACQDAQRTGLGHHRRGLRDPGCHHGRGKPPRRPGPGGIPGAVEQAVAMSFGFLGRLEERLCLYSQLTGVVPSYQSRGLGHALKIVQRYYGSRRGPWPDCLGLRSAPGRERPLQSQPPGSPGPPLHRQHVRRADRRPQRGCPDRSPDRRVGDRQPSPTGGDSRPRCEGDIAPSDPNRSQSRGRLVPLGVQTSANAPRVLLEIPRGSPTSARSAGSGRSMATGRPSRPFRPLCRRLSRRRVGP